MGLLRDDTGVWKMLAHLSVSLNCALLAKKAALLTFMKIIKAYRLVFINVDSQ